MLNISKNRCFWEYEDVSNTNILLKYKYDYNYFDIPVLC